MMSLLCWTHDLDKPCFIVVIRLSELRAHKTLQTIREQFCQIYGKHYQIRVQVEYDHLFLCSIRGVVVFGVEGELVSLTESFTKVIDVIFAAGWLNKKKVIASQKLSVSISHDSRIFAPQLRALVSRGIIAHGGLVVVQYSLTSRLSVLMIDKGIELAGRVKRDKNCGL
ncbi:hypothetical protein V6N11_080308 [Hibiscus sabdariffa]|uniref:Uncharacterized protein n=1 Tax=Hibiscus sabdariffa TaxID=183260 RepID=A0ABR2R797_9ROSI